MENIWRYRRLTWRIKMALEKTITTIHGFEAVNAYHRVEGLTLLNKTEIRFHVRSYKTANDPFFQEQILSSPYDLDGDNPIKQAYKYLKTLPEFQNAEDC